MLGDTERVSYDPKNPNNARDPSNGATKWLWIGIGISVLVMVIGVWTFFVRLVELAGGLILLHWGFKRRHQVKRGEAPTTGPRAGSVMASVGKWMQAMAETRSLSEPGSFLTGDEGSDPLAHLANEAATVLGRRSARTASFAAEPVHHESAPPGWYVDPSDATKKRWCDGASWGTHVQ